MSDQVIRYETEEEYLEYTNHRRYLATGMVVKFPHPYEAPEAYWAAFDKARAEHPDAVFESWTILHKEHICSKTGKLLKQDCTYDTLRYDTIEEGQVSRKFVREGELSDPGVPVSVEFNTTEAAERVRALLMQGEPGYYYDIKHRAGVAVVEDGKAP